MTVNRRGALGFKSPGWRRNPRPAPSEPTKENGSPSSGLRPKLRRYLQRFTRRPSTVLTSFLGELEIRVLEALWTSSTEGSVKDLQPEFPNLAYTTLMTTLDRLYTKGVLFRRKKSRAYFYSPRFTREELESYLVKDAFDTLLGQTEAGGSLRPVLTSFIEAVSGRDELLLDELEELIRIKKETTDSEQGGE